MSEMDTSNSVVKAKGGRGPQMVPGVGHCPPGTGGPQPHHQQQQQQQDMDFMSFQQQEFNSWRNPPPPPHHANAGDYNNFNYYGAAAGGYSPFSPGDIRDSIAAIWSRTSPSGEGVPLGGAYGQFPPPPPPPPHPDGQFNHLGHFPHGDLSGLFADQYGGFPYGYGYTQWPDNSNGNRSNGGGGSSANPGYSYLGSSGGGAEDPRSSSMSRNNVNAANINNNNKELRMSQLIENIKISSPNQQPPVSVKGKMIDTNGYNGSSNMSGSSSSLGSGAPTKKMSWAKVASQPAKPTTTSSKTKKPGVLSPPAIIPMSSSKGVAPTAVDPVPSPSFSTSQGASPVNNNHSETSVSNGNTSNNNNNGNIKSVMQQQQTSNHRPQVPNYGPRGHRSGVAKDNSTSNASSSSSNGPRAGGNNTGSTSESHPVLENLRSTNEYNPKNFDLNPMNARYFVLKSFCEDDIHRSIKFEIWCSTQHGNKRLDTAWNEQLGVGPIYLFFSVNGSGHFCGMAQMLTGVDYSSTANSVWVQDKFKGQFKVKWIYVKDVPNNQLRHILLENNENKPVTKSRDTQEVPSEKGQMLLKVMHGFKHTTCIFDDFAHYERRQEAEESKKNERQQQQQHHHHHDKSHDKNRDNSARESSSRNNKNPWDWEMNNASNWE
ncbi:uncharacterized protein Ythdf isoform X1 [Lepeophtheirus salmonis]|uniref:uncharacterized protein Ythdf isoform X1 n=1 Tax=Lepeophtheirus salmonis TaxID=72036 RepID=UPI003AF3A40E